MTATGIDRIGEYARLFKGRRTGLMTNPTGITSTGESSLDVLARHSDLVALFAPEHGVRGDRQDGARIFDYVDEHREKLSQAHNYKELLKGLNGRRLLNDFVKYAADNGVKPHYGQIATSRELLTNLLQAYIARDILGDDAFYPIYMSDDVVLHKACELLEAGKGRPELPAPDETEEQ